MDQEIRIDLTREECATRATELSQLIRNKSLAEEARKDAAKTAQEEISEMDTRIHLLAREIREKCRYEPAQMPLIGVRRKPVDDE